MSETPQRTLVWDLPTRAVHWLLALSFAGAYLTADSERLRDVHMLLGYTAFGLVVFRLLWGIFGTRYARFTSLPLSPAAVIDYLKSLLTLSPRHYFGHNPAGSWAMGTTGGDPGTADDNDKTMVYGFHTGGATRVGSTYVTVRLSGPRGSRDVIPGDAETQAQVSGTDSVQTTWALVSPYRVTVTQTLALVTNPFLRRAWGWRRLSRGLPLAAEVAQAIMRSTPFMNWMWRVVVSSTRVERSSARDGERRNMGRMRRRAMRFVTFSSGMT